MTCDVKILPGASSSGQDGCRLAVEYCAMQEAFRKVLVTMGCPAKVLSAESGSPAEFALRREIVYANRAGGSVRSRWVSFDESLAPRLAWNSFTQLACCVRDWSCKRVLCVTS